MYLGGVPQEVFKWRFSPSCHLYFFPHFWQTHGSAGISPVFSYRIVAGARANETSPGIPGRIMDTKSIRQTKTKGIFLSRNSQLRNDNKNELSFLNLSTYIIYLFISNNRLISIFLILQIVAIRDLFVDIRYNGGVNDATSTVWSPWLCSTSREYKEIPQAQNRRSLSMIQK